jgi:2-iminobutanoate/2-iminopropanoate deaminase
MRLPLGVQKRDINSELASKPASTYSQAIEVTGASRFLFISGQVGSEVDGTIPPGMEEQARLAWRNLGAQLAAAGMGFDNLVKVTMIVTDATEIPASRAARAEALGDRRPASTLIVGGLANPAYKIEIEGMACA